MRWLIILPSIATVACTETPRDRIATVQVDSIGITVTSISGSLIDVPQSSLGEQPEMMISGADEPYLGAIGAVAWLSDGRLVVEDQQSAELHLFGPDGGHIAVLGGRGDGPGEFQNVGTLSVGQADTLYAYDRRHRRLSVLHPDTGYLGSITMAIDPEAFRVTDVWALGRDTLLAYAVQSRDDGENQTRHQRLQRTRYLSLHDGRGAALGPAVSFQGGFSITTSERSTAAAFSNTPAVAVGPESIVYASGSTYALTVRDIAFVERHRIMWPARDEEVSQLEVDSVRQITEEWYSDQGVGELAKTLADLKMAILPQIRPPLGRVLVDEAGRIWVSEFEPIAPGLDEARQWHVLDKSGRPVGRVTLPLRSSILAVSVTAVTLVIRDELDVQRIEVRRIVERSGN